MTTTYWSERFFETTRGRVVELLRGSTRTVGELADALELTANAVRTHLAALERDGLVERHGVRRGVGKPAHLYRLTTAGERGFSRAYAPVLATVLAVLADRLDGGELDGLLDATGRRAADAEGPATGPLETRIDRAVARLRELGAAVEVEVSERAVELRGRACPLAQLDGEQASACRVVRGLLAELTGRSVRERCERGERPRCIFEVPRAAGNGGG